MSERTKFILDESQIPAQWYNVIPDLPAPPPPPLHPGTGQPVGPDDLAPLFPMELIRQEVTGEPYVDIPGEVIDVYKLWRPTPLFRARRLEKLLNTPARIYYKYEGVSPAGSHKPNTAVPQAYYNSVEGTKRLTTETGAGQWGSALAFATAQYGLDCEVWMVRASYDQKPHRRTMMQTWGATVHPSPSRATQAGLKVLADSPDSPGSLGIAIAEAVEAAAGSAETRYALGSVLNHVLLHQTVIGQEALAAVRHGRRGRGARPDRGVHRGRVELRRAVLPVPAGEARRADEPGDPRRRADRVPVVHPRDLRVRLRRHGGVHSPAEDAHARARVHPRPGARGRAAVPRDVTAALAHVFELGMFEAVAKPQRECFAAAVTFARAEGIIPAPEPSHAIAEVVEEAKRCAETGESKVILTALCGHGHFDMVAYERYLSGEMTDFELPQDRIDAALAGLPGDPGRVGLRAVFRLGSIS